MINCIMEKGNHRIISHSILLWVSVVIVMLTVSAPAFCYELNGTATGNLLSGGYAGKTDDFSVSADVEKSYALIVEKDGKTFTADGDNAQYLNVCGDKVYYTTIDGIARKTILRCYDVSSNAIADLYAVPIGEGMKNLFVLDDTAYFQSNGIIKSYHLDTGSVATVKGSGEIAAFVPVGNFLLYTVYDDGSLPLYAYDLSAKATNTLAKQVTTFDVYHNDVYYSDGETGLYRVSLNGGSAEQLTKGTVNQIVCNDTAVYWQGLADDAVTSLSYGEAVKDVQKVDDYTSFSVLDNDIETVEEAIGEGGSGAAASGVSTSGLPSGTYKSWKQTDSRWSSVPMGSTTVGSAGCLVTAVAILLVGSGAEKDGYLAGTFTPGVFATKLSNNGGFTSGGGLVWGKVNAVESTFSVYSDTTISSSSNDQKASTISSHISAGRYVTICVNNPSTGNTHWLAADYVSGSTVYECDPGYSSKTGVLFTDYPSVTRIVSFSYSGVPWSGGDPTSTVATPTFSAAEVSGGKKITLNCSTADATLYYTLDGTKPTTSSTKYTGPFIITATKTVKVIAVCSGYNNSAIASETYVVWDNPFTDVASSAWYYESVGGVYGLGVFSGTSATTFSPNDNTTRAMFVTVMGRLSDKDLDNYYYGFSDVNETKYYASSVNWAASQGIVYGITDCTFCPDQNITREQACVIMVRFADYMGIDLTITQSAASFNDSSSISSYAKDAVTAAQRAGLINGKSTPNETIIFDPQGNATRAEIAAIISRLIDKM